MGRFAVPGTSALHYGQAIFEGAKAYKDAQGNTRLFRIKENIARMNRSAARLCMPALPEDLVYEALLELLKIEEAWIPKSEGTSLYIRPTYVATEEALGVHAAKNYLFYIILSPSGAYYAQGMKPVKIYVEDSLCAPAHGGIVLPKLPATMAALQDGELAEKEGYSTVLCLDV
jgi:branched-chain amino acid aminotransferase